MASDGKRGENCVVEKGWRLVAEWWVEVGFRERNGGGGERDGGGEGEEHRRLWRV